MEYAWDPCEDGQDEVDQKFWNGDRQSIIKMLRSYHLLTYTTPRFYHPSQFCTADRNPERLLMKTVRGGKNLFD
jgi:hypothetical protein